MPTTYRDKVTIVTGAGSGIGQEVARQMAAASAKVIIADIDEGSGTKLEQELQAGGLIAQYLQVDMTIEAQVKELVETVAQRYGRLDYMFNCVGMVVGGEIRDTKLADWNRVIDTNIRSMANGVHYSYDQMVAQGSGHIVNIASAAGQFPNPILGIYGMTKYAVLGLSHTLRIEAKQLGIKVSVVCPGIIKTPIYQTAIYERMDKDKALDLLLNKIPTQEPAATARIILNGVARNRGTISTWKSAHLSWLLYRLSPPLYMMLAQRIMKPYREKLRK